MKLTVLGCSGRMGCEVMRLLWEGEHEDLTLFGVATHQDSLHLGKTVGSLLGVDCDLVIGQHVHEVLCHSDVVIDFSVKDSVRYHSELAAQAGAAYVCCVTGLDDDTHDALVRAAGHVAVVNAPNTSLGVNALIGLTEKLAAALEDYDIDIVDYHHRHKVDSPSGTALSLGKAASRGRDIAEPYYGKDDKRNSDAIGYAVVRAGEIVGEHKVLFNGAKERIELVHKAYDRGVFAEGALKAASWAGKQEAGLYTMRNVLGI